MTFGLVEYLTPIISSHFDISHHTFTQYLSSHILITHITLSHFHIVSHTFIFSHHTYTYNLITLSNITQYYLITHFIISHILSQHVRHTWHMYPHIITSHIYRIKSYHKCTVHIVSRIVPYQLPHITHSGMSRRFWVPRSRKSWKIMCAKYVPLWSFCIPPEQGKIFGVML